jgi:hypothetical protein
MASIERQFTVEQGIPSNIFNDLIEIGYDNWKEFIYILQKDISIKCALHKNKFINDITIKEIKNIPAIYISGGMAYKIYDDYLLEKFPENDMKIFDYSPRTTDFDITVCIENFGQLRKFNENSIGEYLHQLLEKYYIVLNKNDYIARNFVDMNIYIETINLLYPLERAPLGQSPKTEQIVGYVQNKLLITVLSERGRTNFRISVGIEDASHTLKLEHIVELIFTTEDLPYKSIKEIKMLDFKPSPTPLFMLVPDINSLILLTLTAIVNRGLSKNKYTKCKKDYLRLKFLFNKLHSITNAQLIKHIGYIPQVNGIDLMYIFDYIISIIPHCSRLIPSESISLFFDKFPFIQAIKDGLLYIINNINNIEIVDIFTRESRQINELIELYNKQLDKKMLNKYMKYKNKFLNLRKQIEEFNYINEDRKIEDFVDPINKNKYLALQSQIFKLIRW